MGVATLASFVGACAPEEEPARPNVLLISLDSTRRDFLGLYGHESLHAPGVSNTPALEALAARGVVMEEAYATTSWTLPSHVSMLTGEPELVHAVDLDQHRPPADHPQLSELLLDAGYRTAGFFSGPYLEPHFGFERGFERYEARYGEVVEVAAREARAAREASGAAARDADERHREAVRASLCSEEVTDAVLEELERATEDGRPFFLFAHYFDPHYDYVPPAPHDTRFDPGYGGGLDARDLLNNPAISLPDERDPLHREQVVSERDLEHLLALYAGELAFTDAQLGRVFERLEELGLAEDTLVIVTADHGDEFFEHRGLGHRSTLFEEQLRVPMVLSFPGRLPQGRRAQGLVSTLDLVPTVCELLGLEAPAGSPAKSFARLAAGEEDGAGRFVLGRIVRPVPGTLRLPDGGREREVAATRLVLLETYREGPIKITREREWATLRQEVPSALGEVFERGNAAQRAREQLRWIDVERFPAEPVARHSRDFSEPRAAATLARFQALYRELLQRRAAAARGASSGRGDQSSALEALGYAGVDLEPEEGVDPFLFPPPGE